MAEFFSEYGLFLAKAVTWVAAILIVTSSLYAMAREARGHLGQERLEVKNLNRRFERLADILNQELLPAAKLKQLRKKRKAEEKARNKAQKHGASTRPRVFALGFDGDLTASPVESLREEVSAILQVAGKDDEVLLCLESAGGLVHGYGLAASQLTRVRDRGIKLTVAVDKIAASGGYMMACVADRILAAPFAVVGSIGVVAQLPNFNRLLKKHEIDFELHTAGEYKRTLTLFGENTKAARAKFQEELEDAHALFKSFVTQNRPQLDIEKVATGEHWFGTRALALKLVDGLQTSDDYLLERAQDADVFEVKYKHKVSLSDKISHGFVKLGSGLRSGLERAVSR